MGVVLIRFVSAIAEHIRRLRRLRIRVNTEIPATLGFLCSRPATSQCGVEGPTTYLGLDGTAKIRWVPVQIERALFAGAHVVLNQKADPARE
jgi:hypothetical protein